MQLLHRLVNCHAFVFPTSMCNVVLLSVAHHLVDRDGINRRVVAQSNIGYADINSMDFNDLQTSCAKLQRFKREAVGWLSESTKDCNCTAVKNRRHQLGPVKPSRILPDIVDSHGLLFPSHICAVAPGLHGAAWPTHSRLPRKYPKRPKAPFKARTLCRGPSIYPRVGGGFLSK